jgi:hypothetical protein
MYQLYDVLDIEGEWQASDLSDLILSVRSHVAHELGDARSFWKS